MDWADVQARELCRVIESDMRRMGVITTAHYEPGIPIIAAALRAAAEQARNEERERVYPIMMAALAVLGVRRENPEMHNRLSALSDAFRKVGEYNKNGNL